MTINQLISSQFTKKKEAVPPIHVTNDMANSSKFGVFFEEKTFRYIRLLATGKVSVALRKVVEENKKLNDQATTFILLLPPP